MVTLRQKGKSETRKVVVCGAWVQIENGIAEVTRSQKDWMMTAMWQRRNGIKDGFEDITPPTITKTSIAQQQQSPPPPIASIAMPPSIRNDSKPFAIEQKIQAPVKNKFAISVLMVISKCDKDTIKKSLLSLYCQNFKDFEVIIINDKEDISSILDELPGLKYKYVFLPEGKSYENSLKMAKALVESNYSIEIKDGEILEPNKLQEIITSKEKEVVQ